MAHRLLRFMKPAIWGYPDDFSIKQKVVLRKLKIKRIFNVNKYSR